MTPNGWTSNEQSVLYFKHSLAPQARAKCQSDDERVLVIFDQHQSHLSDELYEVASEFKIDLYALPPNTTNMTQPLDVGIFGSPSRRFTKRCEEIVAMTGSPISRDQLVQIHMEVHDKTITPAIVKAAWRDTGLVPFDPNIFTDDDFAPCRNWSTRVHLPPSYPYREFVQGSSTTQRSLQFMRDDSPVSVSASADDETTEDLVDRGRFLTPIPDEAVLGSSEPERVSEHREVLAGGTGVLNVSETARGTCRAHVPR